MSATAREILRQQILCKKDKAQAAARYVISNLDKKYNEMAPEDVAHELHWASKHTADAALWSQVYSELYDISKPTG